MRCSLYTATLLLTTAVRVSSETIRGVNLGGWLLTERWITPSLFASTNTDDEWSLCNELGKDKCAKRLGDHWKYIKQQLHLHVRILQN
jgi:glucan 1,3-beta-glucosidase